jgi:phosphate transport system substrate-binding protein
MRLALAILAALALFLEGCSDSGGSSSSASSELSGEIVGAGSSAQSAAQEAWIAAFQTANEKVTMAYDPVGSGAGREQFITSGVAYGGSDTPLEKEEFTKGQDRCGGVDALIEAPVYVSPIAIVFNLSGIDKLRLSPDTIASIFAGKIDKWDDPAIAATNPGVTLPDTTVTAVHRSDKSGTTEIFTHYLSATAPDVWTSEPSGNWPLEGGEAAQGTSGVLAAVKSADGTVGYADAGQAGSVPVAAVEVGNAFVDPTPEAAAKIFAASKESAQPGAHVSTYDVDYNTTAAGTYPIVLLSYMLACTKYPKTNEAKLVQGYLKVVASPDGQAAAAKSAGSAPIPSSVEAQIQAAAAAIQTS